MPVWAGATRVALLGLMVAACSIPVPLPTPTVKPSPTGEAFPSPSCEEPAEGSPTLTCEKAVAVGITSLKARHPRIDSIEFHYGWYCPPGGFGCGMTWDPSVFRPHDGWVVFSTKQKGEGVFLTVLLHEENDGTVTIVGRVPPAGASLDR